jgi:hypothetical protein
MPIWSIESVSETPEVILDSWRVFDVPLDGPDQPWTRHFVGDARGERQGQVSSAVEKFDVTTRCGVTRSGRIYQLAGRPGLGSDAQYVWNRWKRIAGVAEERDMTQEVLAQMPARKSN